MDRRLGELVPVCPEIIEIGYIEFKFSRVIEWCSPDEEKYRMALYTVDIGDKTNGFWMTEQQVAHTLPGPVVSRFTRYD